MYAVLSKTTSKSSRCELGRVVDRARHSAVAVDAPGSGRQRRFVAVHHRDVVALSSELEHEVTTDVPVASHHQHAHCRDPNQGGSHVLR